jgi:hypothetical protein
MALTTMKMLLIVAVAAGRSEGWVSNLGLLGHRRPWSLSALCPELAAHGGQSQQVCIFATQQEGGLVHNAGRHGRMHTLLFMRALHFCWRAPAAAMNLGPAGREPNFTEASSEAADKSSADLSQRRARTPYPRAKPTGEWQDTHGVSGMVGPAVGHPARHRNREKGREGRWKRGKEGGRADGESRTKTHSSFKVAGTSQTSKGMGCSSSKWGGAKREEKSSEKSFARLENAVKSVKEQWEIGSESDSAWEMPSVMKFNKALKLCVLDHGNVDLARRVMALMASADVSPDLITYNTMLDVCAKSAPRRGHKAFLHGLKVFESIAADGLEPDLISFNSLLNVACKGAAVPDNSHWSTNALKVLAMMEVSP